VTSPAGLAPRYLWWTQVRDEQQTEEVVARVVDDFGRLDGTIANAGVVSEQRSFLETTTVHDLYCSLHWLRILLLT
jgi:NAD(P)-dependent dehydrogenase (short-subunit alcohol dehydrogenase family)